MQSVCSRRASWIQLVQRKCADARTTRSLVVIKVDRSASSQYCTSAFSAVSSGFLKPFSGKMTYCPTWLAVEWATGSIISNFGKFEDLVLMIAERQAYRQRDRDIIQTCYSIVKFFYIYICFFIFLHLNLWTWSTLHFMYQYFPFTFSRRLLLSFHAMFIVVLPLSALV